VSAPRLPWPEYLDALEERLRRQAEVVSGSGSPDAVGPLPEPDGPLPISLRSRAVALLARSRALEAEAAARLAELRPRPRPVYGSGGTTTHVL
jgi:hypothetical protein